MLLAGLSFFWLYSLLQMSIYVYIPQDADDPIWNVLPAAGCLLADLASTICIGLGMSRWWLLFFSELRFQSIFSDEMKS